MRIDLPPRLGATLATFVRPLAVALVALASAMFTTLLHADPASPAPSPGPSAAPAPTPSPATTSSDPRVQALGRASDAVLGVQVIAVEDARSNATLGRMRQGSGVVIGQDDLVLTIGYLILEADQVQLVTDDARVLPARVVAYDLATGFGLLQALAPLRLPPVPLGRSEAVQVDEPLMMVSGGAGGTISISRMVSRRPFAGDWEYHIEGALFTSPPRTDHSGAALFNSQGELMGIGSLFVTNALGSEGPDLPGNMFVPVDLLRPIIDELRSQGSSAASRRAWLGLNCIEQAGAVRVVRVTGDSPAQEAGLQPGDSIVTIDGTSVTTLDALWKSLWNGGLPERDVVLEIRRGPESQRLTLHSVDRMTTLRKAKGI
jgi:serine protease Do